jgi:hypothetical protein
MNNNNFKEEFQARLDLYHKIASIPVKKVKFYIGAKPEEIHREGVPREYFIMEWYQDFSLLRGMYPEYSFYGMFDIWEGVEIFVVNREYEGRKVIVIKEGMLWKAA